MLNDFIQYLLAQIGEPYLWGGQHTKLTPENYKSVIDRKETTEQHKKDAMAYCEKKFAEGYTVLYAYDCSGLGVYWITDVKHLWASDANANTMLHRCVDIDTPEPPEKGWWVFKLDAEKKRATHIGYMVDDEYLVEAKGRAYGVVKTKWRERDWDCWGIPKIFEDEIRKPTPPEPITPDMVIVKGKSVRVRDKDSTKGRTLFIAHKGDSFPFICVAPSGWYRIETKYPESYITNLPRYTEETNG